MKPTTVALSAVAGVALFVILAIGMTRGPSDPATDGSDDMVPSLPNLAELATDTEAIETDGDAAFRARVRDYLLEEPEVLIEAMQVLEQRRMVEEAAQEADLVTALADDIFEDGHSYVGGNPDGSITVVEFQDYRCGYCKRAHGEVAELISSDGDIRLIIKEFPILGEDSMTTSRLAVATMLTQGDEAYKRMSDALMTYGGAINDAAIDRLAASADVDIAAVRAALDDPEIDRRIAANHDLGRALSISGTPTFIIGEKLVRGYLPLEEMRQVVDLSRSVAE